MNANECIEYNRGMIYVHAHTHKSYPCLYVNVEYADWIRSFISYTYVILSIYEYDVPSLNKEENAMQELSSGGNHEIYYIQFLSDIIFWLNTESVQTNELKSFFYFLSIVPKWWLPPQRW